MGDSEHDRQAESPIIQYLYVHITDFSQFLPTLLIQVQFCVSLLASAIIKISIGKGL